MGARWFSFPVETEKGAATLTFFGQPKIKNDSCTMEYHNNVQLIFDMIPDKEFYAFTITLEN